MWFITLFHILHTSYCIFFWEELLCGTSSLQSVIYWQFRRNRFKWNYKNQAENGPYTFRTTVIAAMTVKTAAVVSQWIMGLDRSVRDERYSLVWWEGDSGARSTWHTRGLRPLFRWRLFLRDFTQLPQAVYMWFNCGLNWKHSSHVSGTDFWAKLHPVFTGHLFWRDRQHRF